MIPFFLCPSIYIDMYLNPALYIAPENYFFSYLSLFASSPSISSNADTRRSIPSSVSAGEVIKTTYEPDAISGCSKYLSFKTSYNCFPVNLFYVFIVMIPNRSYYLRPVILLPSQSVSTQKACLFSFLQIPDASHNCQKHLSFSPHETNTLRLFLP